MGLRARLLSVLRRRQAERGAAASERDATNAATLQFQTIVVVVDKSSGAIDHQICQSPTPKHVT
ncbi:hypothetical protein KR215_008427 [Drosophila sulfurigaster]|nr:hypothetical protein KR215_008427 [Drosophila sulfurigaster]